MAMASPAGSDGNSHRRDFTYLAPSEGPPRAFRLSCGVNVTAAEFFTRYAGLFGLGAEDEMVSYQDELSPTGFRHIRFAQRHGGGRVSGAEMILTVAGHVTAGVGRVIPGLELNTSPSISPEQARAAAASGLARRLRVGDPHFPGNGRINEYLLIAAGLRDGQDRDFRLIYRCVARLPRSPIDETVVDIDAHTGRPVRVASRIKWAWQPATCTGQSVYNGPVQLQAETQDDGSDLSRLYSPLTITLDAGGSADYIAAVDVLGLQGVFADDPATKQAVSVMWAAQQVTTFFQTACQRPAILEDGSPVTHYVNVNLGALGLPSAAHGGANYSEKCVIYNLATTPLPAACLDLVAHESTHLVAASSIGSEPDVGFGDGFEAASLGEGFADAFACFIEIATLGAQGNWQFEESLDNPPARDLADPHVNSQPAYYGPLDPSQPPDAGNLDPFFHPWISEGSAHHNCTIVGHCFYLLSEGGTGLTGVKVKG